jgi:hypothetical protein
MATDILEELEFSVTSQGEVFTLGSGEEETGVVAFKLLRHAQCVNIMDDECDCCRGAAQECIVTCR